MIVCFVLFFVFLGDGILSDWVPAYIQESTKNPLIMGFIVSFSSVVGFLADLVFPEVLKKVSSKKMIVLAIGSSLIFCGVLLWSTWWPWMILFLMAMAVWGIYYEFLGFGGQQFISDNIPAHFRAGAWAVLGAFRGLAYFVGPIIGSYVMILKGNTAVVVLAAFFVCLGYVFWLLSGGKKEQKVVVQEETSINIFVEAKHWFFLLKYVWPIVTISLVLGLLDATFWTTGTVLSDNMARESFWGGMFLPLYEFPMVLTGLLVAKWGVYKGKKRFAEIFMLVSGLLLILLRFGDSLYLSLGISFLVGVTTSFCWPLRDAIYSDLVSRMGFAGKHMIGLSGSTVSLAYVIGPILSGYLANIFGEKGTFVVMGVGLVVVSTVLLLVTPKKMRLPEKEIEAWG